VSAFVSVLKEGLQNCYSGFAKATVESYLLFRLGGALVSHDEVSNHYRPAVDNVTEKLHSPER
jgi:hypothetical protein